MTSRRARTGALLLLLAAAGATGAQAAPVRGTFAYDYRNVPNVADFLDRELVILSARGMLAPGRADSLKEAGVKPLFLLQPNQAFAGGAAIGSRPEHARQYPWDTATWRLVTKHDALMRDSTGGSLDMFAGTSWSSMVLDFRNRPFGREYAALLVEMFPRADGVVLDYGCGDLGWMGLSTPRATWVDWKAGWIDFLAEVRRLRPDWILVSQCDQWNRALPVDAVLLERVGAALNPRDKTLVTARALAGAKKRVLLRQEGIDARTRRFFSGLALLFDGAFDECGDPNFVPPIHRRDVEHFELAVGRPAGDVRERSRNVLVRAMERGVVVVNASDRAWSYDHASGTRYKVAPGDALVLQDRDAKGRPIPPRTNAGR